MRLGSNSFGPTQLPQEAKQAVITWLSEENTRIDQVEFVQGGSAPVTLNDAELTARPTFTPKTGGPSFDCAHAGNDVERTICSDTSLAALDLALSKLYNEIRHGFGSQRARQQLEQLQREWLRQRDRACATGDSRACLRTRYATQMTVLSNWIPVVPPPPLRR